MKKQSVIYSSFLFVIIILIFTGCSSAINIDNSTSSVLPISTIADSISAFPTLSPSTSPSDDAIDKFPMSVSDFFIKYKYESFGKDDWTPTQILNYTEEFGNKLDGCIKGYIKSVNKNEINIEKINWVEDSKDGSGYKIVDTYETTKYQITKDTQIWLLLESYGDYQISLDDLISYNKKFSNITIWNVAVDKNKVVMLVEQYQP